MMSRHIPSAFEIPLWLSSRSNGSAGPAILPYGLAYMAKPLERQQARFQGRLVFEPMIDLGRYTCKAAIDWIWLEIKTARKTQSIHLRKLLLGTLGRNLLVTGPTQKHDVESARNHTGDAFRLKLQDPTPVELKKLAGAIDDRCGLVGEIRVLGIEIAVDFFPAKFVPDPEVDADRHRIVAVLQRHHLANWDLFNHPLDDLRQTYGAPWLGEKPDTRYIIPDPNWRKGSRREDARLSDNQVRQEGVQHRILTLSDDDPLFVDSTVYRGRKGGNVGYRVQNKETDGSDPERDGDGLLPLRKRRARVEVTLLHEGVTTQGITMLDELFRFNFVRLRKPLFPMYLPTSPGGRRHVTEIQRVVDGAHARFYRKAFVRGGCYAVVLRDRARRQLRLRFSRKRRRDDPSFGARKPFRIGSKDHLIEWREMNHRVEKALRRLADQWQRRS